MAKDVIIKLSHARLEALYNQYANMVGIYERETDHEDLLYYHLVELHNRLYDMMQRMQRTYTLSLSTAESLAMMQLWRDVNMDHCPYSKVILQEAAHKTDKRIQSPVKIKGHGNLYR